MLHNNTFSSVAFDGKMNFKHFLYFAVISEPVMKSHSDENIAIQFKWANCQYFVLRSTKSCFSSTYKSLLNGTIQPHYNAWFRLYDALVIKASLSILSKKRVMDYIHAITQNFFSFAFLMEFMDHRLEKRNNTLPYKYLDYIFR